MSGKKMWIFFSAKAAHAYRMQPSCYLFWFLSPTHAVVGLDIQDEMGRHEVGHIDNSMKIPLNNGDGCRFEGHFSINKVSRNEQWLCWLGKC